VSQVARSHPSPPLEDMVWIPGGSFSRGSDTHYPEEGPVQWTTVGGFWMDAHPVSNAQFAEFVAMTREVACAAATSWSVRVHNETVTEMKPGAHPAR